MNTLLRLPAAALLWLGASAVAHAAPFDIPDIPRCTELAPGAVSLDATPVTLGLRIVLDGVSREQAAALVNEAQAAYAPLNISFAVSYDVASFGSVDGVALLDETKRHYHGQRPGGTHLVFVVTAKNLTDAVVGDALAGQADCIGGVAYAENAFAVGEADPQVGGHTMAHELGHLMGGHHHLANCAESLLGGDNLCTLMFNDVGFASLLFSTVNGAIVRGHAQLATGNAPLLDVGNDGLDLGAPATGATGGNSAAAPGGAGGGAMTWLGLLLLGAMALRKRAR